MHLIEWTKKADSPEACGMVKASHPSFLSVIKKMRSFGERLQMARLRRELTTVQFSERVGVSRETSRRLEQGDPTIAIANVHARSARPWAGPGLQHVGER
jgi:DNA-binding XRE family transcriptional regulator